MSLFYVYNILTIKKGQPLNRTAILIYLLFFAFLPNITVAAISAPATAIRTNQSIILEESPVSGTLLEEPLPDVFPFEFWLLLLLSTGSTVKFTSVEQRTSPLSSYH